MLHQIYIINLNTMPMQYHLNVINSTGNYLMYNKTVITGSRDTPSSRPVITSVSGVGICRSMGHTPL